MNFKPKYGEKNPHAKLNWEKVRQIKHLERLGEKRKDIAEKFGVSHRTVTSIILGERWNNGAVYVSNRF